MPYFRVRTSARRLPIDGIERPRLAAQIGQVDAERLADLLGKDLLRPQQLPCDRPAPATAASAAAARLLGRVQANHRGVKRLAQRRSASQQGNLALLGLRARARTSSRLCRAARRRSAPTARLPETRRRRRAAVPRSSAVTTRLRARYCVVSSIASRNRPSTTLSVASADDAPASPRRARRPAATSPGGPGCPPRPAPPRSGAARRARPRSDAIAFVHGRARRVWREPATRGNCRKLSSSGRQRGERGRRP